MQYTVKDTDLTVFTLESTHLYKFPLPNRPCVHAKDISVVATCDTVLSYACSSY